MSEKKNNKAKDMPNEKEKPAVSEEIIKEAEVSAEEVVETVAAEEVVEQSNEASLTEELISTVENELSEEAPQEGDNKTEEQMVSENAVTPEEERAEASAIEEKPELSEAESVSGDTVEVSESSEVKNDEITEELVKASVSVSAEESVEEAEQVITAPGSEAVTVNVALEALPGSEEDNKETETESVAESDTVIDEKASETLPQSEPAELNTEGELVGNEKGDKNQEADKSKKQKKPNKFAIFLKTHKLLVIIVAIVLLLSAGVTVTHFIMTKDMVFIHKAEDLLGADKGNLLVFKSDIEIKDSLTLEGYSFDMNDYTLTVNGTLTINGEAGKAVNIGTKKRKEFLAGGMLKADTLIFNGTSSTAVVRSDISTDTLQVNTSGAELYGAIKGNNTADCIASITAAVQAKFYSSLTGGLTLGETVDLEFYGSADSIENGKTVTAYDNAVCALIEDADKVVVYPESSIDMITGVDDCVFIEYLAAPELLIVKEGVNFVCYISEVQNADFFDWSIEGQTGRIASTESNFVLPALTPGQYKLSVTAGSTNESYNSARATSTVSVHYTVKLAKPVIRIEVSGDNVNLVIEEVDHATEYVYKINGREFNPVNAGTIDITEYVAEVGQYTVYVFARNTADSSYEQSDTAMTSYINRVVLAMSEITVTDNGDDSYTANWASVANTDYYVIVEDGVVTYTRATTYTFTASSIIVSVKGNGFYVDSAPVTVLAEE